MRKLSEPTITVVCGATPITDEQFARLAAATVELLREADAEDRAEVERMIQAQEQRQRALLAA